MRVAVVGLWHLGTVTAGCLAAAGNMVIGFEQDSEVTSRLQQSILPVSEPGLQELFVNQLKLRRLSFSSDPASLTGVDVVWVAYDTPVDENDNADPDYVLNRVSRLFPCFNGPTLFLISSQLPVGSTRKLELFYRRSQPEGRATFAYSPENLRLGKAIEAFTKPERVVVGVRDGSDKQRVAQLLQPFTEKIEWMSVESAEMTKHALNAFLATSVAFINELAVLCEEVGADASEVERGLKSDVRVGPRAYLRAGQAFAGGTLARDVSALIGLGRSTSTAMHLLTGVRKSNNSHKEWPKKKLVEVLRELKGKSVGVLGLTYKPGTDTLRRSSALEVCRWLHEKGAMVLAFDPAVKVLPDEFASFIRLQSSLEGVVRGTDTLYLATEWPEFTRLKAEDLCEWMSKPRVVDPGRFLEGILGSDQRIQYFSIGRAR